ncbi:MAG: HD domain-containing protein [Alphaproteobacteria bacterium]|nr:HD domain-containing protein [Alphaproteobacteria bacterium]
MVEGIVDKAKKFASQRHKDMCRPNAARQPSIEHLSEVASLVESVDASDQAVAAAWLHDIIEDTQTTLQEIEARFGHCIASLVDGLTDPMEFASLPLQERKMCQAQRLRNKSLDVLLVKLCDQISNIRSVLVDPPLDNWDDVMSLTYANGAKLIADVCKDHWPQLDKQFSEVFQEAITKYSNANKNSPNF